MTGTIFDIKEMAVHDGPGIRTTVFLKGCPLRCKWCHNPEGLTTQPQLMFKENRCVKCGKCMEECSHEECKNFGRCVHICPENCLSIAGRVLSHEELAKELIASADAFGDSFGGFTFSGGEPLAQFDFIKETVKLLKGYHICIETSGYASSDVFEEMTQMMDYIYLDIKLADDELHKRYTGVSNEQILKNYNTLKLSGKPYCIRTPLISGITNTNDNLEKIKAIIGDSVWEKLPENVAAGAKYKMLGMGYEL